MLPWYTAVAHMYKYVVCCCIFMCGCRAVRGEQVYRRARLAVYKVAQLI